MFDWPEQTQTSPTRMLSISILFLPLIFILSGSDVVAKPGNLHSQRPRGSAVAVAFLPASSTVTSSPGEAVPQTGSSRSCCSTILLAKTDAGLTSARDACAP